MRAILPPTQEVAAAEELLRRATPEPPDLDGLSLAQRECRAYAYAANVCDVRLTIWTATEGLPDDHPLRPALDARYMELEAIEREAYELQDATQDEADTVTRGPRYVANRKAAERRILRPYLRRSPAGPRVRLRARRGASRRPRTAAARSSARSGDSGDDGPCSHRAGNLPGRSR
ncbi:MAG: hypothetical protein QOH72_5512 [Solirubrobacteraceae bacterium]|jgi:hypothetical protein|nr:hypothetical protein [Solirubrobacteraceae bacterium]